MCSCVSIFNSYGKQLYAFKPVKLQAKNTYMYLYLHCSCTCVIMMVLKCTDGVQDTNVSIVFTIVFVCSPFNNTYKINLLKFSGIRVIQTV